MTLADPLFTINGLPVHPLLVHVVVVLVPLAAVGAIVIALVPNWRRRYWLPVLVVAVLGITTIPFAQQAGRQLIEYLGGASNPDLQRHAAYGNGLLPYALAFGGTLIILLVAGWFADQERKVATEEATDKPSKVWRIISIVASVAVVVAAVTVIVEVVWTGDSGSAAVWKGIVGG